MALAWPGPRPGAGGQQAANRRRRRRVRGPPRLWAPRSPGVRRPPRQGGGRAVGGPRGAWRRQAGAWRGGARPGWGCTCRAAAKTTPLSPLHAEPAVGRSVDECQVQPKSGRESAVSAIVVTVRAPRDKSAKQSASQSATPKRIPNRSADSRKDYSPWRPATSR